MMSTFKSLLQRRQASRKTEQPTPGSIEQRAQSLLDAIDKGGIPLNPAIVNDIARQLGMEVSSQAPMDETIGRIRAFMARHHEAVKPSDKA